MSWVMFVGPPLICVCERQKWVFISFDRQATWDPELLSALPEITQLVTRKMKIKSRFPDCQTRILSSHPCSFLKNIWLHSTPMYLSKRKETVCYPYKDLYTNVIAALLHGQHWKCPNYPSRGDWIKTTAAYAYKVIFLSNKKQELLNTQQRGWISKQSCWV